MDQDCIKLTSYFGERHRIGGRFIGDALVELYGSHEIPASILLRGIEGFGRTEHLRTDHSLTLSEDLPVIAIAVDSRPRIEAVLDQTLKLNGGRLVTLERARLLSGEIDPVGLPDSFDEATKLTIYFCRRDSVYQVPAFEAICELLHRRGIAGATALTGIDGTIHGQRLRPQFFSRHADAPTMVTAVGSGERLGMVLPELGDLLRHPLITLEQVRICKRDGQLINGPDPQPGEDENGIPVWHKLTVYTSEAARHEGQPIHRTIIRRLRAAGISGATTLRGLWGFHGDHLPHGGGRHAPMVTIVIDSPERIATAFGLIDELTAERGLVTSETIPAMRPVTNDR